LTTIDGLNGMTRRDSSADTSVPPAGPRPPSSDPEGPNPPHRSRRVRSALLLAVAAILGVWLSVDTIRAFRQRATVGAIWSLGGYVRREHEGPEDDGLIPHWYRKLLGDDFMDPLVTVRLAGTEAGDEHLVFVGKATRLQMLDLRDTRISDAGLDHLRGLSDLRLLILTGTAVSDDGLAKLKDLPRLRLLCLEETKITDRGLQNLTSMANLGWLNLAGTQITDAGLSRLKDCPSLEVLILERCDLSEAALSEFRRASPRTRIFNGSTNRPWLKNFDLDHLN
jgi:hypothetical protein